MFAGLRGPDLRFPPTKPGVPRQQQSLGSPGKVMLPDSPNQVLTHAARAAAKQPLALVASRARRALVRANTLLCEQASRVKGFSK